MRAALQDTPLWRQYREFELHPQDQSNWFGPNVIAVLEAFQSAGFDIAHIRSWGNRAAFRAKVGPLPARFSNTRMKESSRTSTWLDCILSTTRVALEKTAVSSRCSRPARLLNLVVMKVLSGYTLSSERKGEKNPHVQIGPTASRKRCFQKNHQEMRVLSRGSIFFCAKWESI